MHLVGVRVRVRARARVRVRIRIRIRVSLVGILLVFLAGLGAHFLLILGLQ